MAKRDAGYQKVSRLVEGEIAALFKDIASILPKREDSRAFGAMVERKIAENWSDICKKMGVAQAKVPGRRTIFDFAYKDGKKIFGFDVKTKDLDATRYSDGGVCVVGNLLQFLANDGGVFFIVEFEHTMAKSGDTRRLKGVRVAPFHALPKDAYRIENLGTGQVRLNRTIHQMWGEIDWKRDCKEFFDLFCDIAVRHYKKVQTDSERRMRSIERFQQNDYASFTFTS